MINPVHMSTQNQYYNDYSLCITIMYKYLLTRIPGNKILELYNCEGHYLQNHVMYENHPQETTSKNVNTYSIAIL